MPGVKTLIFFYENDKIFSSTVLKARSFSAIMKKVEGPRIVPETANIPDIEICFEMEGVNGKSMANRRFIFARPLGAFFYIRRYHGNKSRPDRHHH